MHRRTGERRDAPAFQGLPRRSFPCVGPTRRDRGLHQDSRFFSHKGETSCAYRPRSGAKTSTEGVPAGMENLLSLPGVGRKTANLVVSACFGVPGIIVDTHVMRVAFRLGIYGKKDPAAIETTIRRNMEERWHTAFSHALNRHGKFVCKARSPALCFRRLGLSARRFLPENRLEKQSIKP